jgi:hypothetical protein
LADADEWFAATRLPRGTQELADALEIYLGHDGGLASLSNWVLEDLPMGRAHSIDSDTDSAWAFVLLLAQGVAARDSEPDPITIGPNTYARREVLLSAIAEINTRGTQVAEDLRIRQLHSRVLPMIRGLLTSAIQDYERRESDRLEGAELDLQAINRLATTVKDRWQRSPLRSLLTEAGSIRRAPPTRGRGERFGLAATAPKIFFIGDDGVLDDSPERIGEDLARGMSRGEENAVAQKFLTIRALRYGGSLEDRLDQAIRSMRTAGLIPTHGFVPVDWRLWQALSRLSPRGSERGTRERKWIFQGVVLEELSAWRDPSIVLVQLPQAIQVVQFENDADYSVDVQVEPIADPDIPNDVGQKRDPSIRISAYERWRLRVVKRYVRRVAVNDSVHHAEN